MTAGIFGAELRRFRDRGPENTMLPKDTALKPYGTFMSRSSVLLAAILGIFLQIQSTLNLDTTALRLSLGDVVLAAGAPLVMLALWKGWRRYRDAAGMPVVLTACVCSAVMTVALFVGREGIGHWTAWALIKYAGWYVLLGYAALGLTLAMAGGRNAVIAFAMAVVAMQCVLFCFYFASIALNFETVVKSGPRLVGWTDNANAMALNALIGFALSIGFNAEIRARLGGVCTIAVPSLLGGMILLTQSVSGVLAFMLLLGCIWRWRTVGPSRLVLIFVCGLLVWLAPHMVSRTLAGSVFEKTFEMLIFDPDEPDRYGIRYSSRDSRIKSYNLAVEQWISSPLVGTGLGSHLAAQEASGSTVPAMQVHSTGLWLAAETGLLGLFAFGSFFFLLGRRFWRGSSVGADAPSAGRDMATAALLALIAAFVMSMFHELMYQRLFWAVAGLALGYAYSPADVQREVSPR